MKRWLCTHCQKIMRATKQPSACEGCKLSAAEHPRFAGLIVEVATVHFDPPSRVPNIGLNRPACKPKARAGSGFGTDLASGEPANVCCELCLATPEWRSAMEARDGAVPVIPEEYDEELTPKTQAELAAEATEAAAVEQP